MTKEDFKTRLEDINTKYEQEKKRLYLQYAHENNIVNIGDTVEDHIGCGRVLKMKATFASFDKYPTYIKEFMEDKKDGTPKKKEVFRQIYQINVKKVNGKPVNYENH